MAAVALSEAVDGVTALPGVGVAAGVPTPLVPPAWPVALRPGRLGVPPEFTGRARQLVAGFAAQDQPLRTSLEAIFAPLKRRMRDGHSPHQRREDLAEAVRLLDRLPARGLLVHTRTWDKQKRTLDDWRLVVASGAFTKISWIDPHLEPALLIAMITMKIDRGKAALNCDVIAVVGLHAIARFMQRSLAATEVVLLADLKDLALHYDVLLQDASTPSHRWQRETGNGLWVGETVHHDHRILLSADSFFGADFTTD